ncbi:alpha-protein kinase vwkA-like [Ruditapes philippinarum]|uniref:alpha-protein kinase vwkA-like n=1 Tax=Ruditapes philippinarum TaxID=129788 RepID=UPI00295C1A50|nr:alpha-protein kinase vwkA-like [Ruditapes philippinarum]
MAVWMNIVVEILALFCLSLFEVRDARVIKRTTGIVKFTTTPTMKTTTETVKGDSSILSMGGELPTVSETSPLLKNGTTAFGENSTMPINGTTVTYENTTELINGTKSGNITLSINGTGGITINKTISTIAGSNILDLAFIMDTTGSMGSYIHSARNNIRSLVDEIAVNSDIDLRIALIEYRDHPPQETTFVTRTNDFTKDVELMKKWLNKAQASGGGDGPEAVAEGLYDVTKLSWRPEAARITVLISDAPPHGLAPWKDSTFKEGSPNGHDPMKIAQDLAKREIIIYAVGCEPSIDPYKDFFMALAYITGGQYIPLSDPRRLIQAIIGGAQEELSLQKFSNDVEQEINRVTAAGGVVDEASIAQSVYEQLQQHGATSKQLLRNDKPLEGASGLAKKFAAFPSMDGVRKAYKSERDSAPRRVASYPRIMSKGSSGSLDMLDSPMYPSRAAGPPALDASGFGGYAESVPMSSGVSGSSSSGAGAGESYSTVDSAVSYEQIARLVRKKTAKLSTP